MTNAIKDGALSVFISIQNISRIINKILTYICSLFAILVFIFWLISPRQLTDIFLILSNNGFYQYILIWFVTFIMSFILEPVINKLKHSKKQKNNDNKIKQNYQNNSGGYTTYRNKQNKQKFNPVYNENFNYNNNIRNNYDEWENNNHDTTNNPTQQQNNQCQNDNTNNNSDYPEDSIFDPKSLKITKGFLDSEKQLKNLIGLSDVKEQIKKIECKMQFDKKREKAGIDVKSISNKHMCFYGPPGTGKTTVARIITGILFNLGVIKENKCVEINGELLKGAYIGHTAIKTKAIIKEAYNGILFIDEAYLICDNEKNNGFGKEALGVILKEMEDNRDSLIVIFAGYEKEMNDFIKMNSGLKSRISNYIYFNNYSSSELCEILLKMCKDNKYEISKDALNNCKNIFEQVLISDTNFGNGRYVETLLNKIIEEHAFNFQNKSFKDQNLNLLSIKDIPKKI